MNSSLPIDLISITIPATFVHTSCKIGEDYTCLAHLGDAASISVPLSKPDITFPVITMLSS